MISSRSVLFSSTSLVARISPQFSSFLRYDLITNNKVCEMPLKSNDHLTTVTAPVSLSTEKHKHYVDHNYHDHSQDIPFHLLFFRDTPESIDQCNDTAILSAEPKSFPVKLQELLDNAEAEGYDHIISWQPHGRAFLLHKKEDFVDRVLPRYFGRIQLLSFKRQLNLYDFKRITQGPDRDTYYHEMLLRGMPFFASCIHRKKSTGLNIKLSANPEAEPKFYLMPSLPAISSQRTLTKSNSVALPEAVREIRFDNADFSTNFHRRTMSIVDTGCPAREAALRIFSNSFSEGRARDDDSSEMLKSESMFEFLPAEAALGEFSNSSSTGGGRMDDLSFSEMELDFMNEIFRDI